MQDVLSCGTPEPRRQSARTSRLPIVYVMLGEDCQPDRQGWAPVCAAPAVLIKMLACVVIALLIIGAASAGTIPRLRENDLRGIATRPSNGFEPERVAGYFRLNRTHAGKARCCCVFSP